MLESRFADPVTAVDLSLRHICFGSAMGRIAFHDIKTDKDYVISESQPELIRGISHSLDGDSIFYSVGDISCSRLDTDTLNTIDFWQIIDDPDGQSHRDNCERSFTLNHQHYNCVLTIQLQGQQDKKNNYEPPPPINLSNLEMNELTPYGEGEFEFNQNTVPFDFDGQRLLWMTYSTSGMDVRDLFFYDFRYAKK